MIDDTPARFAIIQLRRGDSRGRAVRDVFHFLLIPKAADDHAYDHVHEHDDENEIRRACLFTDAVVDVHVRVAVDGLCRMRLRSGSF